MAIARLSVKVGKAGKAAMHADYIAREGVYAARLNRGEVLEGTESGNMPDWAAHDPAQFWRAADANERANGTTYREFELALPRELTPDDRADLVRAFVSQELGERHPYQWAIHRPKAADGQEQPHAHLMFSERRQDGIARDPDQFFKRWNAKHPERGGAHKRFGEVDGPNRSQAQRQADLRALRDRWGELVNRHLERAGVETRIDMRSHRERGIDRTPEPKQLPSAWRDPERRGEILELRQAERGRDQARAKVRQVVPDPAAALARAERELAHQRRLTAALQEYADRQAGRQPAEPKAPAAAPRDQLAPPQPTMEAPPPRGKGRRQDFGQAPPAQDPERVFAGLFDQARQRHDQAAAAGLEQLRLERERWTQERQAHQEAKPWNPLGRGKWEAAGLALDIAGQDLAERERAAWQSAHPKAIETAALAELRRDAPAVVAAAETARQAREAREREQERQAHAEKIAKREREQVAKDFNSMAMSREVRMYGYTDRSEKWQATPAELRDRIEAYLKIPKDQRPAALERINRDPKTRDRIQSLMQERDRNVKELDRGMSR